MSSTNQRYTLQRKNIKGAGIVHNKNFNFSPKIKTAILGRQENCEFFIRTLNTKISRLHCKFAIDENGKLFIENLQSRLWINENKMKSDEILELKEGDQIGIGVNCSIADLSDSNNVFVYTVRTWKTADDGSIDLISSDDEAEEKNGVEGEAVHDDPAIVSIDDPETIEEDQAEASDYDSIVISEEVSIYQPSDAKRRSRISYDTTEPDDEDNQLHKGDETPYFYCNPESSSSANLDDSAAKKVSKSCTKSPKKVDLSEVQKKIEASIQLRQGKPKPKIIEPHRNLPAGKRRSFKNVRVPEDDGSDDDDDELPQCSIGPTRKRKSRVEKKDDGKIRKLKKQLPERKKKLQNLAKEQQSNSKETDKTARAHAAVKSKVTKTCRQDSLLKDLMK